VESGWYKGEMGKVEEGFYSLKSSLFKNLAVF
jgi:hypothetical protein